MSDKNRPESLKFLGSDIIIYFHDAETHENTVVVLFKEVIIQLTQL